MNVITIMGQFIYLKLIKNYLSSRRINKKNCFVKKTLKFANGGPVNNFINFPVWFTFFPYFFTICIFISVIRFCVSTHFPIYSLFLLCIRC